MLFYFSKMFSGFECLSSIAFRCLMALPSARIAFSRISSLSSNLFIRLYEFYSATERFNMFVRVITKSEIMT